MEGDIFGYELVELPEYELKGDLFDYEGVDSPE